MTASHERSWVQEANLAGADFPLANLPLCVFGERAGAGDPRIGAGIGAAVLDLRAAGAAGLLGALDDATAEAMQAASLNPLFALGRPAWRAVRAGVAALLREGASGERQARSMLRPMDAVEFALPAAIGDYTDFFTSYNHAYNAGALFRPDSPVFPNFHSLPIAYHGRASSIVVSGTPVVRPKGQARRGAGSVETVFGPTRRLDFEMELGAFIGPGNPLGRSIAADRAEDHIAGLCLVNDWSARDVQAWETQPLGPFLGKNFATSISPWVVSLDALEPYRVARAPRRAGQPPLHDYLLGTAEGGPSTFEIRTEVQLSTARMREQGLAPVVLSRALFSRDGDWAFSQMVAHHTVNGCNLRPGDLIGSGTISGPDRGTEGCLLELTRGGAEPLALPGGETRAFLQDGDELTLTAYCERPGLPRIGFGRCTGTVLPALAE
ncbi:fumarylacetoacetase [Ramlibacter sp. AW1]|uniref:fumarylacetoacetase n=1 Tax=Ramlibacter aurantiacus TaxID=2801330 RepID=A0A937D4Q1_9BURK|nr:fumarylacetoacetase [Ramlibacter aurantiacus]